jgi:hypothetical protein
MWGHGEKVGPVGAAVILERCECYPERARDDVDPSSCSSQAALGIFGFPQRPEGKSMANIKKSAQRAKKSAKRAGRKARSLASKVAVKVGKRRKTKKKKIAAAVAGAAAAAAVGAALVRRRKKPR